MSHASENHTRKAKSHAKVGTFGYQKLDPVKLELVRLLDEQGKPFPPDAIFGYEIVDVEPPTPTFAKATGKPA